MKDIQKSIISFLKDYKDLSTDAIVKVESCMRCFGCLDVDCPANISSSMINELVDRKRHLTDNSFETIDLYPVHRKLAKEHTTGQEFARITTAVKNFNSDILFFPGCNIYKQPDKLLNAITIMDEIGNDYSFLPGMEHCCGWSDRGCKGDAEWLEKSAVELLDEAESLDLKQMIFWCPTCLCVLEEKIKKFYDFDFECISFGEYVAKNIDKLSFPNATPHTVTLHEPCKTSYMGIDLDNNSIRSILKNIPGTEIIEMKHIKENTLCCGCDAVYNMYDIGDKVTHARLSEALDTGAEIMIDVCHNCHWIMKPSLMKNDDISGKFKIENYSTYITNAMGKGRQDTI